MNADESVMPRPQHLTIDAMKLQLFTNLNLLAHEVLMYKAEKRTFWHLLMASKRLESRESTKFVVSINERLDYLLETAKNVFKNPNDPDNLEYRRFEDMSNRIVRQGLIKYKYGGLKKTKLG